MPTGGLQHLGLIGGKFLIIVCQNSIRLKTVDVRALPSETQE
jgi:hypothetical protein